MPAARKPLLGGETPVAGLAVFDLVRGICDVVPLDLSMSDRRSAAAASRCVEGRPMFDAWLSLMMLAIESSAVVNLRMRKFAGGGGDAFAEASLMFQEKIAASAEAQVAVWRGSSPSAVIDRYREHVAANAKRLTSLSTV